MYVYACVEHKRLVSARLTRRRPVSDLHLLQNEVLGDPHEAGGTPAAPGSHRHQPRHQVRTRAAFTPSLRSMRCNTKLKSRFLVGSVDPNDQKKTACFDIDVEVDDPLKSQMSSFLSSTTNQQEIAALEMKVGVRELVSSVCPVIPGPSQFPHKKKVCFYYLLARSMRPLSR